jgi:hypothetical protein
MGGNHTVYAKSVYQNIWYNKEKISLEEPI